MSAKKIHFRNASVDLYKLFLEKGWILDYIECSDSYNILIFSLPLEDFIASTSDGDVRQWTHDLPNPVARVYNVPATPFSGHGPCIPHGDKLRQVSIGAGMFTGITDGGRVHTWRNAMKGGLIGVVVPEKEALTPLGHEESHKDTAIVNLGLYLGFFG